MYFYYPLSLLISRSLCIPRVYNHLLRASASQPLATKPVEQPAAQKTNLPIFHNQSRDLFELNRLALEEIKNAKIDINKIKEQITQNRGWIYYANIQDVYGNNGINQLILDTINKCQKLLDNYNKTNNSNVTFDKIPINLLCQMYNILIQLKENNTSIIRKSIQFLLCLPKNLCLQFINIINQLVCQYHAIYDKLQHNTKLTSDEINLFSTIVNSYDVFSSLKNIILEEKKSFIELYINTAYINDTFALNLNGRTKMISKILQSGECNQTQIMQMIKSDHIMTEHEYFILRYLAPKLIFSKITADQLSLSEYCDLTETSGYYLDLLQTYTKLISVEAQQREIPSSEIEINYLIYLSTIKDMILSTSHQTRVQEIIEKVRQSNSQLKDKDNILTYISNLKKINPLRIDENKNKFIQSIDVQNNTNLSNDLIIFAHKTLINQHQIQEASKLSIKISLNIQNLSKKVISFDFNDYHLLKYLQEYCVYKPQTAINDLFKFYTTNNCRLNSLIIKYFLNFSDKKCDDLPVNLNMSIEEVAELKKQLEDKMKENPEQMSYVELVVLHEMRTQHIWLKIYSPDDKNDEIQELDEVDQFGYFKNNFKSHEQFIRYCFNLIINKKTITLMTLFRVQMYYQQNQNYLKIFLSKQILSRLLNNSDPQVKINCVLLFDWHLRDLQLVNVHTIKELIDLKKIPIDKLPEAEKFIVNLFNYLIDLNILRSEDKIFYYLNNLSLCGCENILELNFYFMHQMRMNNLIHFKQFYTIDCSVDEYAMDTVINRLKDIIGTKFTVDYDKKPIKERLLFVNDHMMRLFNFLLQYDISFGLDRESHKVYQMLIWFLNNGFIHRKFVAYSEVDGFKYTESFESLYNKLNGTLLNLERNPYGLMLKAIKNEKLDIDALFNAHNRHILFKNQNPDNKSNFDCLTSNRHKINYLIMLWCATMRIDGSKSEDQMIFTTEHKKQLIELLKDENKISPNSLHSFEKKLLEPLKTTYWNYQMLQDEVDIDQLWYCDLSSEEYQKQNESQKIEKIIKKTTEYESKDWYWLLNLDTIKYDQEKDDANQTANYKDLVKFLSIKPSNQDQQLINYYIVKFIVTQGIHSRSSLINTKKMTIDEMKELRKLLYIKQLDKLTSVEFRIFQLIIDKIAKFDNFMYSEDTKLMDHLKKFEDNKTNDKTHLFNELLDNEVFSFKLKNETINHNERFKIVINILLMYSDQIILTDSHIDQLEKVSWPSTMNYTNIQKFDLYNFNNSLQSQINEETLNVIIKKKQYFNDKVIGKGRKINHEAFLSPQDIKLLQLIKLKQKRKISLDEFEQKLIDTEKEKDEQKQKRLISQDANNNLKIEFVEQQELKPFTHKEQNNIINKIIQSKVPLIISDLYSTVKRFIPNFQSDQTVIQFFTQEISCLPQSGNKELIKLINLRAALFLYSFQYPEIKLTNTELQQAYDNLKELYKLLKDNQQKSDFESKILQLINLNYVVHDENDTQRTNDKLKTQDECFADTPGNPVDPVNNQSREDEQEHEKPRTISQNDGSEISQSSSDLSNDEQSLLDDAKESSVKSLYKLLINNQDLCDKQNELHDLLSKADNKINDKFFIGHISNVMKYIDIDATDREHNIKDNTQILLNFRIAFYTYITQQLTDSPDQFFWNNERVYNIQELKTLVQAKKDQNNYDKYILEDIKTIEVRQDYKAIIENEEYQKFVNNTKKTQADSVNLPTKHHENNIRDGLQITQEGCCDSREIYRQQVLQQQLQNIGQSHDNILQMTKQELGRLLNIEVFHNEYGFRLQHFEGIIDQYRTQMRQIYYDYQHLDLNNIKQEKEKLFQNQIKDFLVENIKNLENELKTQQTSEIQTQQTSEIQTSQKLISWRAALFFMNNMNNNFQDTILNTEEHSFTFVRLFQNIGAFKDTPALIIHNPLAVIVTESQINEFLEHPSSNYTIYTNGQISTFYPVLNNSDHVSLGDCYATDGKEGGHTRLQKEKSEPNGNINSNEDNQSSDDIIAQTQQKIINYENGKFDNIDTNDISEFDQLSVQYKINHVGKHPIQTQVDYLMRAFHQLKTQQNKDTQWEHDMNQISNKLYQSIQEKSYKTELENSIISEIVLQKTTNIKFGQQSAKPEEQYKAPTIPQLQPLPPLPLPPLPQQLPVSNQKSILPIDQNLKNKVPPLESQHKFNYSEEENKLSNGTGNSIPIGIHVDSKFSDSEEEKNNQSKSETDSKHSHSETGSDDDSETEIEDNNETEIEDNNETDAENDDIVAEDKMQIIINKIINILAKNAIQESKNKKDDTKQLDKYLTQLFAMPDRENLLCTDPKNLKIAILDMYNKQECVNLYLNKNILMYQRVPVRKYSFFSAKQLLRYLTVILLSTGGTFVFMRIS